MKNHIKFLVLGLFWLLIIGIFIGSKEFTLQTGREIYLRTEPIDPRDLFRGDYVVLNYEIGSVDQYYYRGESRQCIQDDFACKMAKGDMVGTGDDIFVLLDPDKPCATSIGYMRDRPKEGLFIKGKERGRNWNMILVDYGIENYFVPEGKGREIENLTGDDLVVKVSVDRFGNAAIKELLIGSNVCASAWQDPDKNSMGL